MRDPSRPPYESYGIMHAKRTFVTVIVIYCARTYRLTLLAVTLDSDRFICGDGNSGAPCRLNPLGIFK